MLDKVQYNKVMNILMLFCSQAVFKKVEWFIKTRLQYFFIFINQKNTPLISTLKKEKRTVLDKWKQ